MAAVLWGRWIQSSRKLVANAALTALVVSIAAPAFASAAGANSAKEIFAGIANANGLFFSTYGPDPNVGPGVRSLTHTRLWFNRASYQFNSVGFMTADSRSNRKLAYQISDQYGNFTYYVNGYTYQPYDANGARNTVSAAMWLSSGSTWHFNWWGTNLNVGVDARNAAGGQAPEEASVGADGWGGCPNAYPVNYAWSWMYRSKSNGYWNYFPVTNRYTWGDTPRWSAFGDHASGGSLNFGTTTCP